MKSSTPHVSLFLFLAASTFAGAGACALSEDEPAPDDPPELGIAETGKEMQGQHILGALMDAIPGSDPDHHFTANRSGTPVHFTGAASLDVAGGILPASNGDKLQFTLVGPQGNVSTYSLVRFDAVTKQWSDPCGGDTAVPFLGTFSRTGVHEATTDRLSFACGDGVARKCVDWGYGPYGDPNNRDRWKGHQACTREARADYCGTGHTHTREETTIALADFVGVRGRPPSSYEGVRAWPPPPTAFYYEAAYIDAIPPAFCFGKARWASLPPDGPDDCVGQIPDPRVPMSGGHFCEEYDFDGNGEGISLPSTGLDILTVEASAYNDLALDLWKSGSDYVSTVQGYANGRPNKPPFPIGTWTHIGMDAILLRRPTGTIEWQPPDSEVVAAYIYTNQAGTDHVLGPDMTLVGWPPTGYSRPTAAPQEGFLFLDEGDSTDPTDERAPLMLYERTLAGGTKEYLSTAVAPPLGAGYTQSAADPLGYVYASPR